MSEPTEVPAEEPAGDAADAFELVDSHAELEGVDAKLEGVDAELEGVDAKLEGVDAELEGVDAKLDPTGHDAGWLVTLSLAYPLGLAWFIIGFASMFAASAVLSVVVIKLMATEAGLEEGAANGELVALAVVVALLCVAVSGGVTRGWNPARFLLAGIGLLQAVWQIAQVLAEGRGSGLGVVVGLACAILALPAFNRWFVEPGRARYRAPSTKPYTTAVTWIAVWTALLLIVTPALKKMFEETGLELPFSTVLALGAADLLTNYSLLVYPLVIAVPLPLLRTPKAHLKHAEWVLIGLGAAGLAVIGYSLVLPILELIEKL